jgi:pimeloyl-ACP methyl ester carboxylesterase
VPTTTTPDGVTIAFDTIGAGSPLVLVHGITESRGAWDPLVADLATDHTVVAIDMRGHGESGDAASYDSRVMADDVAVVVGELGLGTPLVVGHSMGGIVVTAFAGAHPCRGVINVDQSIALGDFQELVVGAEPLLRSDAFGEVVTGLFDSMQGPLAADEGARISALRRPVQEVVLGVWQPLLELSPADLRALVDGLAAQVTVPYLSLFGIDPGPDYPAWLTSVIPTATVEVWADTGHYPHLVHADRFLDRLRSFEATLA